MTTTYPETTAPMRLARSVAARLSPSYQLCRREVAGRYKGSVLGIFWSLLTPLFMLAIYTLVFGTVLKARWTGATDDTPLGEFSVILFAGLVVFQLFAEVINRAPTLILANQNYVTKVVFPLQILPLVALGSALFQTAVSLVVLLVFEYAIFGAIPLTALWLPVVLIPYCVIILGLAWFLASFGTFVRDVGQFLGTVVTALMFLSPVFYPLSMLPEWLRPWLVLNPIALAVEQARDVLIFGRMPDFTALGIYALAAVGTAFLGFLWFQKTRKGFADVL